MSVYDLRIIGGIVVDPANGVHGRADVGIRQGQVVAVEPHMPAGPAGDVIHTDGAWVLPGLVDSHVHVSSRPQGYRMLARAGVTCVSTAAQASTATEWPAFSWRPSPGRQRLSCVA